VTELPQYPLILSVAGRRVVVVGGGPVAARRARTLVDAGAAVHVVAPQADPSLEKLAAEGTITWSGRRYRAGDLDGAWLVHTATGDADVDRQVLADADAARVWCVHAGDAAQATAWVPAVATVDDVVVAVNAGGDPRRASGLRDAIAALLKAGSLPLRRRRRTTPRAGQAPVAVGQVALVGGGPGDPGLLTVRGRRLLAEADVVVVDRLAPHAVLAELDPDVLVVDAGKTPGHHAVPQDRINALLVEHALAGRRVVRLKGGDPYVFGRGSEEAEVCRRAGVPVEVVPGVTSAVAVPAVAGIPVTHRGVATGFTVVAGLGRACQALRAAGRSDDTPVGIVEDGFGPGERTTVGTLATIVDLAAQVGVRSPAVTVVGDVVRLSPAWRDHAGREGAEAAGRHHPAASRTSGHDAAL
jgi:uroporphyrin-III C-methyltransferase/precorrin-2 dehydrogenase/sirohydrochlorin ferrochelatase